MEKYDIITACAVVAVALCGFVVSLVLFGGYGLILSGLLLSGWLCGCSPDSVK